MLQEDRDRQAHPQGKSSTTTTSTTPAHGLSQDRKKTHSNGETHTIIRLDWTRGPCHDSSASNNSEICLRRAFTGKRGRGRETVWNIRRTTQGCRPGKASQQQRGRRPHTGSQARLPDHGNSMRSAEISIPMTGIPNNWRKTGR